MILIQCIVSMVIKKKRNLNIVNNIRILITAIFLISTISFSLVDYNLHEPLLKDKTVIDYSQYMVTIATIIATILAISFSFTLFGIQYMVSNFNPTLHKYVLKNRDSIASFAIFSFMVLFNMVMLSFSHIEYFFTSLFHLAFSFVLLYYYFYSVSIALNAKSLFDYEKNRSSSYFSKYLSASNTQKDVILKKIDSSLSTVFHILDNESRGRRSETVDYGIDTIKEMLNTFRSDNFLLIHLLRLTIAQSKPILIHHSSYNDKLVPGLIQLIEENILAIRETESNSDKIITIVIEIGLLFDKMIDIENENFLVEVMHLFRRIIERFENTSRQINIIIRDGCKKINKPSLVIVASFLMYLSLILFYNTRFYNINDNNKFDALIISPLKSIEQSILLLNKLEIDEISVLPVFQDLFPNINATLISLLMFILHQPTNSRNQAILHFQFLFSHVLEILRNFFFIVNKYGMINLVTYASERLVDYLFIVKSINRIFGFRSHPVIQNVYQLAMSIDNLLISKNLDENTPLYAIRFSNEITRYIFNTYGIRIQVLTFANAVSSFDRLLS